LEIRFLKVFLIEPRDYSDVLKVVGNGFLAGFVATEWLRRWQFVSEVTRILEAAQQGDPKAADELLPLVYEELRRLAAYKMANEAPGHTLQGTLLVHEAYLRLVIPNQSQQWQQWQGRGHFFAAAAEAMRRILVDRAREKQALKRGGNLQRVGIDLVDIALPMPEDELLIVNDALDRLAMVDTRAAQVVKLCFFVGLTQEEAARELGISVTTAERLWGFARAWLLRELKRQNVGS
jgi:RNA polymerase sigma factor (TIGR02999 family)